MRYLRKSIDYDQSCIVNIIVITIQKKLRYKIHQDFRLRLR